MTSHDPLVPPDSVPPSPESGFPVGDFGDVGDFANQAAPRSAPAWPPIAPPAPSWPAGTPVGAHSDPRVIVMPPLGPGPGQVPVTVNNPDVVVGSVAGNLNFEIRKGDILEGPVLTRDAIKQTPMVRSGQWTEAWTRALDPGTTPARLRKPVLIIVAPRSYGSTTFALHLLAETTDDLTPIVKLDADWTTPRVGRLPQELRHAYQLDLKDPDTDGISTDFLDNLEDHAEKLGRLGSTLVLTVAEGLWSSLPAPARTGIHVVHLTEPPPARKVVEAHLRARKVPGLVSYLRSGSTAEDSLNGRDAVEAVRAADAIKDAWQEHVRLTGAALPMDEASWRPTVDDGLSARIAAALSDWRDKLDILFGETTPTHRGKDTSLPLEDRCLLLALAVRQSAPMPQVAKAARSLQNIISTNDAAKGGFASTPEAVFAGRGLRRRVVDAGAGVDTHDNVVFDQPGYGRAVLTYVWDNYEIMREPLLKWLVNGGEGAGDGERVVEALSVLTLRHGNTPHFQQLGTLARTGKKALLSAVMVRAVQDEHAGRHAWGTLYGWAQAAEYASTVIATCRGVLDTTDVTPSQARMAMVRLRRVAKHTHVESVLAEVLDTFEKLVPRPGGLQLLVSEVQAWQQSGKTGKGGPLAFLALMSVPNDTGPWLLSQGVPPSVDVERALQTLLGDITTAPDTIDRITGWVSASATDPASYARIRDRLLPALREQKLFKAVRELMEALDGVPLEDGANAAEDFWGRLVDPRVRGMFPLTGTSA
ncbi:hypothetical protein [Streptomyces sp. NPDC002463]|uniref:hypothetical protein n=1 Tax=Streptomyces sp. NPDC002463 TaxID=3364645 RepID=UPI00368DC633